MNMNFIRKLPIPKEIKEQYPITSEMAVCKAARDAELKRIFRGESDKLIVIVGPCSADAEESVLDYLCRLARLAEQAKDRLFIIPRIYTGKPRTTGDGYMGMLHQPDPSEKPDLLRGIIAIRDLHMRALRDTGLTCADELLYPENHRYLNDLLGYVAVGARSVENQEHRLVASGLDIPVGMKNPTSGELSVMMNAITAAGHPHAFLYRGWEVESAGNPYAHAILRGYMDGHGTCSPNYRYEDLLHLSEEFAGRSEIAYPAVIVDTNHANSGKDHLAQIRIAKDVLQSCRRNPDIRRITKGLMIESYIEDGAQKIGDGRYGCSITDPCLGWKKTEKLLLELAELW